MHVLSSAVFPYDEAEGEYRDQGDGDSDADPCAAFCDVYFDVLLVGLGLGARGLEV